MSNKSIITKIKNKIKRKYTYMQNGRYIKPMIANDGSLSQGKAYKKLLADCKEYSLTKDQYVDGQFYLLDEDAMKQYMTNVYTKARIDCIADYKNKPKGYVMSKARYALNNYGITTLYFAYNNLIDDFSDENLKAHQVKIQENKDRVIDQLARITGWERERVIEYADDLKKRYGVPSFTYIKDHELFKMEDKEIPKLVKSIKDENNAIIKQVKKTNGWDTYQLEYDRLLCRMKYSVVEIKSYNRLGFGQTPDEVRETYAVPMDMFRLRRKYNTAPTDVLDDKTLFDKTYKDYIRRKFWINRDTNIEEFKAFIEGFDEVFCKPINLLGGHGAYRYKLDRPVEEMYEYFMNEVEMLIEEIPKQHHLVNEIYDNCICTVRIMSVLKDDVFHAWGAWMKFGAGGSVVDGRVDGGSFAGVDEKTGVIVTGALNPKDEYMDCHPDTGTRIRGFQIPYWNEVLELTEKALRHVEGINFVGWDVAITEDGPVIIEGNSQPDFIAYQQLFLERPEGMRHKYAHLLD